MYITYTLRGMDDVFKAGTLSPSNTDTQAPADSEIEVRL